MCGIGRAQNALERGVQLAELRVERELGGERLHELVQEGDQRRCECRAREAVVLLMLMLMLLAEGGRGVWIFLLRVLL